MKTLITGISALELWDKGISSRVTPMPLPTAGRFSASPRALQSLDPHDLGVSSPGHLLVADKSNRVYNSSWHCHLWNAPLPKRSIYQVTDDIFITSPEFCFLQLSSQLGFLDSIKLGMEICGGYSTLVPAGRSYRTRNALSNASKLSAFVNGFYRPSSTSAAVKALRYIDDGAESPMETACRTLLCLPYRYGCPGFRAPMLNETIDLSPDEQRLLGKQSLRCDMTWGKIALEYKGREFHAGEGNISGDASREAILVSHGYTVISATFESLATEEGFEILTRALARAIGKRLRVDDEVYLERQSETRAAVLRGNSCTWLR